MTHTAEPMGSLLIIVDRLCRRAHGAGLHDEDYDREGSRKEFSEALDVELAKQREGEPVGWQYRLSNEEGVSAWYECHKQDVEILQSKEGYEVRPVYTHPQQPNAVEVTDEMAEIVIEAVYGDSWCDYSRTAEVRKAMVAALSAVASRDREDAERYLWIVNNVDRIETDGWIWEREAVGDGMQIDLHERINAARRENKP